MTTLTNSNNQLVDIFTKSLQGPRIDYIQDMYAHAIHQLTPWWSSDFWIMYYIFMLNL